MSRDLYTEKVCKGRVMQPHEAMFVGAAVGMVAAGMWCVSYGKEDTCRMRRNVLVTCEEAWLLLVCGVCCVYTPRLRIQTTNGPPPPPPPPPPPLLQV